MSNKMSKGAKMNTKQDQQFSIDSLVEKAKTIQDGRFVLEDWVSEHSIRFRNRDYAAFMANLNKLSKKETKGYHPYFQYVRVLMGAVFAHAKGEFWMSRNIFNKLAVKCGVGQMSGSSFAKFETWLKTRPEPWIRVEVPQKGSKPAMWVLTGLLGAALDRALGELFVGTLRQINHLKCKTALENLEDSSTCLSIESRDNQSYPELTGGEVGLFNLKKSRKAAAATSTDISTPAPLPATTSNTILDESKVPRLHPDTHTHSDRWPDTQNDLLMSLNDLSANELLEHYEAIK